MNCFDCADQLMVDRSAVGVCVRCGAGVCGPHSSVVWRALQVVDGLLGALSHRRQREVCCLGCEPPRVPDDGRALVASSPGRRRWWPRLARSPSG